MSCKPYQELGQPHQGRQAGQCFGQCPTPTYTASKEEQGATDKVTVCNTPSHTHADEDFCFVGRCCTPPPQSSHYAGQLPSPITTFPKECLLWSPMFPLEIKCKTPIDVSGIPFPDSNPNRVCVLGRGVGGEAQSPTETFRSRRKGKSLFSLSLILRPPARFPVLSLFKLPSSSTPPSPRLQSRLSKATEKLGQVLSSAPQLCAGSGRQREDDPYESSRAGKEGNCPIAGGKQDPTPDSQTAWMGSGRAPATAAVSETRGRREMPPMPQAAHLSPRLTPLIPALRSDSCRWGPPPPGEASSSSAGSRQLECGWPGSGTGGSCL